MIERLGCCTGWDWGGLSVMAVLGVWDGLVVAIAERFGSGLVGSPSEEISVEFRTLPSRFACSLRRLASPEGVSKSV